MKNSCCSVAAILLSLILFSGQTVMCGVAVDSMNTLDISVCANWDTFKNKMSQVCTDSTINVSMLFIGDSHLQGGYSTNAIRELLKNDSINAGRGCSFPYSIAKTNGPEDFVIKSDAKWTYSRWGQVLSIPVAGYVVSTIDTVFTMSIYNKKTHPVYPFRSLTFYHSADSISLNSDVPFDSVITSKKTACLVETSIYFSQRTDSCTLQFAIHTTAEEFSLFLIQQKDTHENVTVNVLGMNGISFKHYNNKVDLALLPSINPDLLVIALGTNDIFSRYADTSELRSSITGVITKVRELLPDAAILLTTPNDHLVKKRYKNPAISHACRIIRDVAKREKCGLWDFYAIMGGDSSVRMWRRKELMHTDYVHLTKRGYAYQGELFYKALRDATFNLPVTEQSQIPVTTVSSPEPDDTEHDTSEECSGDTASENAEQRIKKYK